MDAKAIRSKARLSADTPLAERLLEDALQQTLHRMEPCARLELLHLPGVREAASGGPTMNTIQRKELL